MRHENTVIKNQNVTYLKYKIKIYIYEAGGQ